jgi:hypothetical protein
MDISFINNDEMSDMEKKIKLNEIKYKMRENMKNLEKELNKLSNKIMDECKHEFIIEREDGQYGDRWKTCKYCDYFKRC